MVLRDILGDKIKGLELPLYPRSYICWPMPTHRSEINFHLLSYSSKDFPDEVTQKPNEFLYN